MYKIMHFKITRHFLSSFFFDQFNNRKVLWFSVLDQIQELLLYSQDLCGDVIGFQIVPRS